MGRQKKKLFGVWHLFRPAYELQLTLFISQRTLKIITIPLLQVAEQLKNTPEIPQKTSKNRFPLYFVWDKKPTKKPKNFRPGPELKTVFIALEMKFAMIFFFPPGPELKTLFIALEMKFAMTESHFLSYN